MNTIHRWLGALVLLAGLSLAAPLSADAQLEEFGSGRHCLKQEGAVDMGTLRNRTICYNSVTNSKIMETDCLNCGEISALKSAS